MRSVILIAGCVMAGCSVAPETSIEFHLTSQREEYEFSYVPLISDGTEIKFGCTYRKIANASGYKKVQLNLDSPENLAVPWRTDSVSRYNRFGVAIFERAPDQTIALSSGRVFWMTSEAIASNGKVTIPDLSTLPKFEYKRWQKERFSKN